MSGAMQTKRKQAYYEAVQRDLSLCQICGKQANDVHHIVFRSHGGADMPENLICLCREHHEMVHKDEKVWREKLMALNEKHYGTLKISQLKRGKNV